VTKIDVDFGTVAASTFCQIE